MHGPSSLPALAPLSSGAVGAALLYLAVRVGWFVVSRTLKLLALLVFLVLFAVAAAGAFLTYRVVQDPHLLQAFVHSGLGGFLRALLKT